jgi:O-antigen/teichoic acid export membrane protein
MLAGSAANSALSSIIALVITPLAITQIGAHIYGAWLASGDLLVWLQSSDLGLGNLMVQRIGAAHGKGDSSAVARYFGTGMWLTICISSLVGCIGFALSLALPPILNIDGEAAAIVESCFRWGIAACVLTLVHFGFLAYFRAVQRTIAVNVLGLIGTLLNFLVVIILLKHGFALRALAAGMLIRSTWLLLSTVAYFLLTEWRHFSGKTIYDSAVRREMVRATPATSLGVLAFAVMNSSDALVVGMLVGNTAVPAYTFTKKAATVIRSILDIVAFAAYPGFAHLVGSSQKGKAMSVFQNIITLFIILSVCSAVGFIATNQDFVSLWVGQKYYLGPLFTIVFALQMVSSSGSVLANYLYRSADNVISGSLVFSLEALIKLMAVFTGCYLFGSLAIPSASILISIIFIWINYRATVRGLSGPTLKTPPPSLSIIIIPIVCIAAAMIYQNSSLHITPLFHAMGGVSLTVISAMAMVLFMREAKELRQYSSIRNW